MEPGIDGHPASQRQAMAGRRATPGKSRTDYGPGDQEMGGFSPGAGRALVKLGNGISGARAGRGSAGKVAASVLIATVWQT